MPPPAFLTSLTDPSQQTNYSGNCHCKAILYTVTLPRPLESSPSQITQCNCSICNKNGQLMGQFFSHSLLYLLTRRTVHGQISNLKILKGEENLSDYVFGKKNATHKFCKTCGSSMFVVAPAKLFGGDGEDIFGVNVSFIC